MIIDYQRVKTPAKGFSLKNSFRKTVLFNLFFEKFFLYLSWCFSWDSCISWVFSWIFTWILILDLNLWHHQNKLGSFASTKPIMATPFKTKDVHEEISSKDIKSLMEQANYTNKYLQVLGESIKEKVSPKQRTYEESTSNV